MVANSGSMVLPLVLLNHQAIRMKSKLLIDAEMGTVNRVMPWGQVRENIGTTMKSGYLQIWSEGKLWYAHRLIWTNAHGPIPDDLQIDHINGLRSDNRIANLRLVTYAQNHQNRHHAEKNSSSGVKGVYWRSQIQKWAAEIRHDYKKYYLGSFHTIAEAKLAYNNAASLLHTHNPHASSTKEIN